MRKDCSKISKNRNTASQVVWPLLFCFTLIVSACGQRSESAENSSKESSIEGKAQSSAKDTNASALKPFADSLFHEQEDLLKNTNFLSLKSVEEADIGDVVDENFIPQEDGFAFSYSTKMEIDKEKKLAQIHLNGVAEVGDNSCVSYAHQEDTDYYATLEGLEAESAFLTEDDILDPGLKALAVTPEDFEEISSDDIAEDMISQVLEGTEFISERQGTTIVETYELSDEVAVRSAELTRFGPAPEEQDIKKAGGTLRLTFEDTLFRRLELETYYESDEIVKPSRTYTNKKSIRMTNEYVFEGSLEPYDIDQPLEADDCAVYNKALLDLQNRYIENLANEDQ